MPTPTAESDAADAADDQPATVVIGLDLGTTAVKCLARIVCRSPVGPGGAGCAAVLTGRPTGTTSPRPGWHVQDPALVLRACDEALAECAGRLPDGAGSVAAVGLSTALHGLVGLDVEGHPVTDVLTWADTRAEQEVTMVRAAGRATDLHDRTGTPLHPMSPLAKLVWWREHHPEVHTGVHTWTDLKGLLLHHLTGRRVLDRSSAGGTGLLDRRQGRWSTAALRVAGIRPDQLPELVEPEDSFPLTADAAARAGLRPGTRIVAGTSDGPSGNLGTGALGPGVAGLSLGTSGALRVVVQGTPDRLPSGLFCYPLAGDRWVVGGAVSNGGSALAWLTRTLQGGTPADASALLGQAGQVPVGSEGLTVLPYLTGERAPLWDPSVPGMVLGLRAHHGPEHLARATFEGIALQLAAVLGQIRQVAPVHLVLATGGALRLPWQLETLAAALDCPVRLTHGQEGSALGAAILAVHGGGLAGSLDEAAQLLGADGEAGAVPSPAAAVTRADPDPDHVAVYAGAGDRLHTLSRQLDQVADALRSPHGPPAATHGNTC